MVEAYPLCIMGKDRERVKDDLELEMKAQQSFCVAIEIMIVDNIFICKNDEKMSFNQDKL